jgi:hypothetical protein
VPVRVSPTDRIRGHIDELFAEGRPLPEILEEVARLGAQLLMQAALEAEVTEFLGRGPYQRAAGRDDARPGSRNGYREVTVKSTAGPVRLSRPKLRGTCTSLVILAGVSCKSADECIAIGNYTPNNEPETFAEAWNGTRWTLQATAVPPGTIADVLADVSCAGASCTAVGTWAGLTGIGLTLAISTSA